MVHLRAFLAATAPFGPLIEIKTRARCAYRIYCPVPGLHGLGRTSEGAKVSTVLAGNQWPPSSIAVQTPAFGFRASSPKRFRTTRIPTSSVTCLACQQVHLVNPATGKVLGEADE